MTNFDIFEDNFIDFCGEHDFRFKNDQSENGNHNSFIVLSGKNGIGKSRLLQLIREYIVTIKNQNYPYMIVRRLDYGEHDDDYDPDKTDHPLVTENVLKCFGCDFDSWKILIEYLINVNDSKDYQCFGCDFDSWEIMIEYLLYVNDSKVYQTLINGLNSKGKIKFKKMEKNWKFFIQKYEKDQFNLDKFMNIDNDSSDYFKDLKNEYGEKAKDQNFKFTDFIKKRSKDFTIFLIQLFVIQNKRYSTSSKSNSYANLLEFCKIFFRYYLSKIKPENDENVIQNINRLINTDKQTILGATEYEQKIYFDEFKKFYRRQILKKICYGSLKQMLMLNMRYQFDIDEINELITDRYSNYGLNFPYEIERINRGFVDKSDVNDRIIFKCDAKKVKFNDLSPGERLILHLIVLIKDRENIKMQNIDKQIKQVLLLDEPDSHCEANLVELFIEIIQKELILFMKIQVIMTTHNYLTISSKLLKEENLYLIRNDKNDGDKLAITNDTEKSFDILAKRIINLFDVLDKPISIIDKTFYSICFDKDYKIVSGKMYGNLLENFIKRLIEKEREVITNQMMGKDNNNNNNNNNIQQQENSEADDKSDFLNKMNLTDYDFSSNEFQKTDFYVIWPKSDINYAWDLLFFENNGKNRIIHLYQIKNTKKEGLFIETIGKHFYIIIHIFKNLFKELYCNFDQELENELKNMMLEGINEKLTTEYNYITNDKLNNIIINPNKLDLTSFNLELYFVSLVKNISENFSNNLKTECQMRIKTLEYFKKRLSSIENDLTSLQDKYNQNNLFDLKDSLNQLINSSDKKFRKKNQHVEQNINTIINKVKEIFQNHFEDFINFEIQNNQNNKTKQQQQDQNDSNTQNLFTLIKETTGLIMEEKVKIPNVHIEVKKKTYKNGIEYIIGLIKDLEKKINMDKNYDIVTRKKILNSYRFDDFTCSPVEIKKLKKFKLLEDFYEFTCNFTLPNEPVQRTQNRSSADDAPALDITYQ